MVKEKIDSKKRDMEKYHTAKFIYEKMPSVLKYDASTNYHSDATSILFKNGACAGIAAVYYLLLLEAGFNQEELRMISPTRHMLNSIF